jgi:hypothetical protein
MSSCHGTLCHFFRDVQDITDVTRSQKYTLVTFLAPQNTAEITVLLEQRRKEANCIWNMCFQQQSEGAISYQDSKPSSILPLYHWNLVPWHSGNLLFGHPSCVHLNGPQINLDFGVITTNERPVETQTLSCAPVSVHWLTQLSCVLMLSFSLYILANCAPVQTNDHTEWFKVKVTLRLTVSLGVKPKYGTFDHIFFFKVTVLSFWDALSNERSGLSCVGLCHWSLHWMIDVPE